jgi:predicted Fe-S protein YdhL (DUF1289 family)
MTEDLRLLTRKRRPRRRMVDTSIPSPCIQVCQVENDICIGCGRSVDDIRAWIIMTAAEKTKSLQEAEKWLAKQRGQDGEAMKEVA